MKPAAKALLLILILYPSPAVFAQRLPTEIRFSEDGRMLLTGGRVPDGLFDSSRIRNVNLQFDQPDYWLQLTQNKASGKDIPATMTLDGKRYDSVGVRFKGMTSYNGTRNSDKKSFNITVDFVKPDQDVKGYTTLNLNNCYLDRSFIREVFFQHQIRKHVPAAKSSYVHLFINGADWGLYPMVQQLNKEFLSEWFFSNDGINWRADTPPGSPGSPGWGDGTAALNYLGPDTGSYKRYYTLKSNDQPQPWSKLVAACNALNTTPLSSLPAVLPEFLDVDRALWHLASELAFSDDDSYVFKGKMDYYVYYEPETGRITPLEYDGNSVMTTQNQNWSPFMNETKVNYPLLNRLLAVPEWRQRYLAHFRTIIEEEMNPAVCNAYIDEIKNLIDSVVQRDPKKLYTYAQFQSDIPVLKNFITNRRTMLLNHVEIKQVAPVIHSAEYANLSGRAWEPPAEQEEAVVTARVSAPMGIDRVTLYHATGLVGNFASLPMHDDGQHDDGQAGDGVYGTRLPGQPAGTWMRWYVEAVAANAPKSASYLPAGAEHNVFIYVVTPKPSTETAVVINELMASNAATVADGMGEYDDWIELHNTSNRTVDISGWFLSDNVARPEKWMIPAGTQMAPGSYLIFWADEDSSQGPAHCNFKLSGNGEVVMLLDANGRLADSVSFGPQLTDRGYARVPNGIGPFRIQSATFAVNNNSAVSVAEPDQFRIPVSVYPNPAGDFVVLVCEHAVTREFTMRLHDINGRFAQSFGTLAVGGTSRQRFLPLDPSLPAGVYVLSGMNGREQFRTIVVKD